SGPTFNPTKLSGLVLWLDAQDDSTFTLDTSNVSNWRDKSTGGNDAVPVADHVPMRVTSAAVGKPVVHFAGDQALTVADHPSLHFGTDDLLVAVVANWTSRGGLFLKIDDTNVSKPGIAMLPTSSTAMCWAIDNVCRAFQNDAGTLSTAFHTYIGVRSNGGTTETLYVDGTQVRQDMIDGMVDATNSRPLYLGADRVNTSVLVNPITADVGEILAYSGAGVADPARVTQLDSYLRTRWGF
ncbi:MAG: hypothetical protein ABI551_14960, partial [Polyangiaceae bacterium]